MRSNQIQYTYVMPYGRMPMYGGNIYMATGKTILKKGLPILKKIWGRMSADQKRALITGAVNVTARGALKVGDAVRGGLGKVSEFGEAKLGKLLGRKSSKKVGKKARKMIKQMVKEKQPKVRIPRTLGKQLTSSERAQVTKGGEQILSNLLYGRGLAIM